MHQLSAAGQAAIDQIAQRHGFSTGGVLHMLDAVLRGQGGMAQFSHPDFSGSGQWMQGGMTMVSDMFNQHLAGRVDRLCSELSQLLQAQPGLLQQAGSFQSQSQGAPQPAVGWGPADAAPMAAPAPDAALFAPAPPDWWGPSLRWPNSTGAQNGARYAYFAQARRLAVEQGGTVTIYDTLDHQIGGFSQQQPGAGGMSCSSQYGTVSLASLPVVSVNGQAPLPPLPPLPLSPAAPPLPSGWAAPGGGATQPAPAGPDILGMLQKLAELHAAGVLTAEEFATKKAELLARL